MGEYAWRILARVPTNTSTEVQAWVLKPPAAPQAIRLPGQAPTEPPVGQGFEVAPAACPVARVSTAASRARNQGAGAAILVAFEYERDQVGDVRTPLRGGPAGVVFRPTLTSKADDPTAQANANRRRGKRRSATHQWERHNGEGGREHNQNREQKVQLQGMPGYKEDSLFIDGESVGLKYVPDALRNIRRYRE